MDNFNPIAAEDPNENVTLVDRSHSFDVASELMPYCHVFESEDKG